MSSTAPGKHFVYVVTYLAYDYNTPKPVVYRAYSHSDPAVAAAKHIWSEKCQAEYGDYDKGTSEGTIRPLQFLRLKSSFALYYESHKEMKWTDEQIRACYRPQQIVVTMVYLDNIGGDKLRPIASGIGG